MSNKPSRWSPFGTFKPADLRVLGLGLELAVAIGGLGWLGNWLDHRWQTDPWLLLVGIALGTVGGCWNIYTSAKKDGFFKKSGRPYNKIDTDEDAGKEADKEADENGGKSGEIVEKKDFQDNP